MVCHIGFKGIVCNQERCQDTGADNEQQHTGRTVKLQVDFFMTAHPALPWD